MRALSLIATLLALACTGCIHHLGGAKKPAHGWDKTPAECAALRDPYVQKPTLRIFACHSFWYGDHAAVWVGSPSGLWAFWDPAGWYADDLNIPDKDDVICRPFDLQAYWCWRIGDYDGLDMLVFEWDISEKEARRIHRLLTSGCYTTSTLPGICCANVSIFIELHIPYICSPLPPFSIFPGMLGELMWSQDPDRVIVFHKDSRTMIWTEQGKAKSDAAPVTGSVALPVEMVPTVSASRLPEPGTLLHLEDVSPTRSR